MNIKIWLVGTLNQLFIRVLLLKQNVLKNKVVSGKTQFFMTGPFCTPHSICLDIGFWQFCMEMLRFHSWHFEQKNYTPVF